MALDILRMIVRGKVINILSVRYMHALICILKQGWRKLNNLVAACVLTVYKIQLLYKYIFLNMFTYFIL